MKTNASQFFCCGINSLKIFKLLFLRLIIVVLFIFFTNITTIASDTTAHSQPDWKIGYWVWKTGELGMKQFDEKPVDLLYVEVGEYLKHCCEESIQESVKESVEEVMVENADGNTENQPFWSWPGSLPESNNYVAVIRYADSKSPSRKLIKEFISKYKSVKLEAQKAGQKVIGLQLDYDCPTKKLKEYAKFLKELRAVFPKEDIISITALLDWFHPKTDFACVVQHVDEYVPQFYDVAPENSAKDKTGVAQFIDSSHWAMILNSYGKPYRIGIASFGRIVRIVHDKKSTSSKTKPRREIDVLNYSPLEIMAEEKLTLLAQSTSEAGETILKYKLHSQQQCNGSPSSEAFIKMIIPTQKSVLSAYTSAKNMGGWCKGVVFFRWPIKNEAMAFTHSELINIIENRDVRGETRIEAEDGLCAAVSCSDLYLQMKERFPQKSILLRIRASHDLEYFLPDHLTKMKMTGQRFIDVMVPAYAGVPKIYLGRAVTIDPAKFTIEERYK